MAKKSGLGQLFYVGGHDLGEDVSTVVLSSPRRSLEVTGISKSGIERLLLHGDALIDYTTFFDDAAVKAHVALKGLPTADSIVLYGFGVAIDDEAAFMVAKQIGYDPTRGADGSLIFNVQAQANGVALEYGVMLTAADDTHSSATSSASKDDSASSAAGLAAVLHIIDIGSGTPTVTIEDSANNSTWANLLSFAAVADGAEPAAERKTVSGTVDRYLRVTTTGTFTDCKFAIAYRRGLSDDDVAY